LFIKENSSTTYSSPYEVWSNTYHLLGYNDSFKTYKPKSRFDWWIIILLSLWRICISLLSHKSYWWWHIYRWKIAIWSHFLSKSLNPIRPQPLVTWYISNGIFSIIKCVNTKPTYPQHTSSFSLWMATSFFDTSSQYTSSNLIFSSSTFWKWSKKYIKTATTLFSPLPSSQTRVSKPHQKNVMITQFIAIIFGPTTYQ